MGNIQSHTSTANSATTITIDTPPQPPPDPPPKFDSNKPPNKLSKPRTNNSSSNNLLNLSTVSVPNRNAISQQTLEERPTIRRRYSVASMDTVQLEIEKSEKERSRRERSRTRKALGLFRRRSVQAPPLEILATGANNHAEVLEVEGLEMKYSRHNSMPNRELSKRFLRRNTMAAPMTPAVESSRHHSRQNSVANSITEEPAIDPTHRPSRRDSVTEEMAGDPTRRYSRHNSFIQDLSTARRFSRQNSISEPDHTGPHLGQSSVTEPDPRKRYSRQSSFSHEGAGEQNYASAVAPAVPELAQPHPVRASAPFVPYLPIQGRLSNFFSSSSQKPPQMQPAPPERRMSVIAHQGEPLQCLPDRGPGEDEPVPVPIRRRSLLQPGIATRAGNSNMPMPEPTTPRASLLPSSEPARETDIDRTKANDSQGKSMSSTLGTLVSLALAKGKFSEKVKDKNKARENERFRVLDLDLRDEGTATPDLEYRHIGGYKFGTLRITNGTASPASLSEDEYFPAAGTAEKREKRGKNLRSQTMTLETGKKPWGDSKRPESPLRQVVSEAVDEAPPPKMDLKIITTLAAPQTNNENNEILELKGRASPNRAQDLAQDYMQDLPISPFSFDTSPRRSPMLKVQATSKHTAAEDHLFDLEEIDPVSQSYENGYQAGIAAALAWQAQAAKNGTLGQQPELINKPLSKADSGYSSNTSLRSSKSNAQTPSSKESPPSPLRESITRDSAITASSMYSRDTKTSSIYSRDTITSDHTIRPKRSFPSRPVVEGELRLETLQELTRIPPPVPLKGLDDSTFSLKEFEQAHAQLLPMVPSKRSTVHLAQLVKSPTTIAPDKEQGIQGAGKSGKEGRKTAYRQSLPVTKTMEIFPGKMSTGSEISTNSSGNSNGNNTSSKWRPWRKEHSDSQAEIKTVHMIQAFPASAVEKIDIPPIPCHVSRSQMSGMVGFPGTSSPNEVNIRKRASKERLGNSFSVESLEERHNSIMKLQSELPTIQAGRTTPVHVAELINEKGRQTPPLSRHSIVPMASGSVMGKHMVAPTLDSSRRKSMRDLRGNNQSTTAPSPLPDTSRSRTNTHRRASSQPKNPYDLFLSEPTEPAYRALAKEERAKTMTSKLELAAAARSAESRRKSQEGHVQSHAPVGLARKSNEARWQGQEVQSQPISIPPSHKSSDSSSSLSTSQSVPSAESPLKLMHRLAPRMKRAPPQVHKTRNTYIGLGMEAQAEAEAGYQDAGARTASMTSLGRVRSPPPVSLNQQRKFSPGQIRRELAPTPSLPPTPMLEMQPQMERMVSLKAVGGFRTRSPLAAPVPPRQQSTQPVSTRDTWAGSKNNSRQRRQSSAEIMSHQLKSRKSTEYISSVRQPQQQTQAEFEHAHQSQEGKSSHFMESRNRLKSYRSFDTSQTHGQGRYSHYGYASQSQSYIDPYYQSAYMGDEYDHTYGSASRQQQSAFQHDDPTYYEAVDDSEFVEPSAGQFGGIPSPRSTSTSDMFIHPLEVGLGDGSLTMRDTGFQSVGIGRRGGDGAGRFGDGVEFEERRGWGPGVAVRG
ncbi:hypothetical protein B7463_g4499, partial [Scytalidium lignicola]